MSKRPPISKEFLSTMRNAQTNDEPEKVVEDAINTLLYQYLSHTTNGDYTVRRPSFHYNTDGLICIDKNGLFDSDGESTVPQHSTILVEVKKDKQFTSERKDIIDVVCQVVSYCHIMREAGSDVPVVAVIADQDEVFLLPIKLVSKYITGNYRWDLAPSSMMEDTTLWMELYKDNNINPFITARTALREKIATLALQHHVI